MFGLNFYKYIFFSSAIPTKSQEKLNLVMALPILFKLSGEIGQHRNDDYYQ